MKKTLWGLAWASLAVCLIAPAQHFAGSMTVENYKTIFLAASISWFVFAIAGVRFKSR